MTIFMSVIAWEGRVDLALPRQQPNAPALWVDMTRNMEHGGGRREEGVREEGGEQRWEEQTMPTDKPPTHSRTDRTFADEGNTLEGNQLNPSDMFL
jgi:hypothetical protein